MNQETMFERSKELVPGGVHSPVRSFKGLHCTPRFMEKASGAKITDTDGKDYIDFCMSFGPLILGHGNQKVKEAVINQLDKGWSYGACEPYSMALAEFLLERLSFAEQIRFVNSGTEAVMTAVRLARGYTAREKIVKFDGCYHGHLDNLLIKAGSGLAGTAEASSKGVSESLAKDTLILELGDLNGLKRLYEQYPNEIALVAIEPLPANNGLLIQEESFLQELRKITQENGSVLLFDEVISGFRIGFGGMAEETGIKPDLVTYGKIIGGGMPVGAVAGPKNIMEHLAPIGGVYQAGTLSANPLAMVAGLETLKQLTPEKYDELSENTQKIKSVFEKWFKEYNKGEFNDYQVLSKGSLFWIVPGKQIFKASEIPSNLAERFHSLFKVLLDKGIYLAPNAYEVGFVSLAHDNEIIKDLEQRLWD